MGWFDELSVRCVAEFGAPDGFTVVEAALVGGDGTRENFTHCKVRGAVYEPVTRGKRRGEPNWRKPNPGTKREFFIPVEKRNATLTA